MGGLISRHKAFLFRRAVGAMLESLETRALLSTVDLSAAADATVRGGTYQNSNYGIDPTLNVKLTSSGDNTRETYIRFDLASVSTVNSAKLRMYGNLGDTAAPSTTVQAFTCADTAWSESAITFANRPASGSGSESSLTISSSTAQWHEWDVSNYVQQQKNAGKSAVTFVLKASSTTSARVDLNSDEAIANKPVLRIDDTANTTTTLFATADSYVRDGSYASSNYGEAVMVVVKKAGVGNSREAYLKFDLNSVAGTISSGILRLYGWLNVADTVPVAVYGVTDDNWSEGTITYDNRPTTVTALDVTTSITSTGGAWYEWDISSYIQQQRSAGE